MPRRNSILARSPLERVRRDLSAWLHRPAEGTTDGPFLRRLWMGSRVNVVRAIAAVAAGWMGYVLVAGDHGLLRMRSLTRNHERLEHEVSVLESEIAALRTQLTETTGDDEYLERLVRESYGLVRPGEVVYRFEETPPRAAEGHPLTASEARR